MLQHLRVRQSIFSFSAILLVYFASKNTRTIANGYIRGPAYQNWRCGGTQSTSGYCWGSSRGSPIFVAGRATAELPYWYKKRAPLAISSTSPSPSGASPSRTIQATSADDPPRARTRNTQASHVYRPRRHAPDKLSRAVR